MSRRCRGGLTGGGSLREALAGSPCDCERLGSGVGGTNICIEPLIYGSNILRDPGFEYHLSRTTGGPLGDEIPEDGIDVARSFWTDGSEAPSICSWMADLNHEETDPAMDVRWMVSDVNPYEGDFHARYLNGSASNLTLWPVGLDTCAWDGSQGFGRLAARCEPGDYVKWTFRHMVSSTSGTPRFIHGIDFQDWETNFLQGVNSGFNTVPSPASYTEFSIAAFAPVGTVYIMPFVAKQDAVGSVGDNVAYDFDAFKLEMIPAGEKISFCLLTSTLTIVNTTTETSLL